MLYFHHKEHKKPLKDKQKEEERVNESMFSGSAEVYSCFVNKARGKAAFVYFRGKHSHGKVDGLLSVS